MSINYQYLLRVIDQFAREDPAITVLDYGCGRGEILKPARLKGINVYGVDIFHSGLTIPTQLAKENLLGDIIREIKDGTIQFQDEYFNLVVSNQVFEHVSNLDSVLKEIARVLKPNGVLYTLFPPKEIILENHTKIPFLHWFGKTKARYTYALIMRWFGFGSINSVKNMSFRDLVERNITYIDTKTFYRKEKELHALFSKYFDYVHKEEELIYIRAEKLNNLLGKLMKSGMRIPLIKDVGKFLFTRLAGYLIVATPKQNE